MNYREVAVLFVQTAFCLIDIYEHAPTMIDPNECAYLSGDYGLRMSKDGCLNVVDPNGNLIAHSFNKAHNQTTYVGKLLAIYLEHLQMDD